MVRSRSIIATPPGATIKEQLIDRGMSQKEFSERMDMSEKHISRLINGEVQLTPDMAVRLEMVLGVPAQFWSKLEAIYREKLAKANIENAMAADIELVKKFPYREMAHNGWVPEADTSEGKVFGLRKHFEVVNLGLINSPYQPQIACRRLSDTEKADYALDFGIKIVLMTGIITALISFITIMGSLNNPSALGPNLAVATLTVLYGIVLSMVLFIFKARVHNVLKDLKE